MKGLYDHKPIIACSSGTRGNAALAVIRLSGFEKLKDLQKFFSFNLSKVEPRKVYQSNLLDNEKTIDNIVLTYFAGPKSFNGENILELSVHGNQLNVQNILNTFTADGTIRLAEPGEFTYRALMKGKLSLSQVEGLDLLLNANSSLMLEQGLGTMHGELYENYLKLHDYYVSLKASIELAIDFSEDVGDEASLKLRNESFEKLSRLIDSLNSRIQGNISELSSPEIVLVGQTNAGKSSLFNQLLKNNRSIVSNQAGTTRDFVSEYLFIEGTNYRLIDTAGLRETGDSIESEGIQRSLNLTRKAFFKILVINPFQTNINDFSMLEDKASFDLVLFTHADLEGFREKADKIQEVMNFGRSLELSLAPMGPAGVLKEKSEESFRTTEGLSGPIEPLLKSISSKYNELASKEPILIERHRESIKNIYQKTTQFQEIMDNSEDIAVISSELNLLGAEVEELIGVVSPDEVLGSIFSNFCIGK